MENAARIDIIVSYFLCLPGMATTGTNIAGTMPGRNILIGYFCSAAIPRAKMTDTAFSWRRATAEDLPGCLGLHPAKNGSEIVGPARAREAWQKMFGLKDATRAAVVERRSPGRREIAGFGFAAFVKEDFAGAELGNPQPGLNSRIVESIVNNRSVIATLEEVRDANTRGALQQVILDTSWKNVGLTPLEVDEVRILLGRAYQELFAGYRLSRIISELVDRLDVWHLSGGTAKEFVFDHFEAYRLANPGTTWNTDRALAFVTKDSIRRDPHSIAADLFRHREPKFGLSSGEQELLEAALDGLDDEAASDYLCVGVPALKRRWLHIFERVAAIRPDLCSPSHTGVRGVQKRQRILAYIRTHAEELRPFDFRKQNHQSG